MLYLSGLNAITCFKGTPQRRQVEPTHRSASVPGGQGSSNFRYTIRNLEEMRLEISLGYISHSTVQDSFCFCNWGGKISLQVVCMMHTSFRGYEMKMSGQKYFERCQSNAHLPQCYQSIQEILYLKYFIIYPGMKSCRKKKLEVLLFMGPFIISKMNLHVLRLPSLSSVQDTI